MIREGKSEKIPSYIQSGRDQGMILMDMTLRHYLEQGLITGEEAYMFAQDKSMFEKYFHPEAQADPGPRGLRDADKHGKKPAAVKH